MLDFCYDVPFQPTADALLRLLKLAEIFKVRALFQQALERFRAKLNKHSAPAFLVISAELDREAAASASAGKSKVRVALRRCSFSIAVCSG
jgi:hypothetical protein